MATIRELLVKINGDNSGLNAALIKSGQDLELLKKNAKATSLVFTEFGKAMSLGVTAPILAAGAAIIKSTADMEMQTAAFETMLGSAEDAAKMMDQIKAMAAKTPFGTSDLANASKTLLQFGVNARDVLPTIKQLGDVSGGNAQRFQQLSLAFGQMSSAGRLMGQDLLQMINAGFNPLKTISEKTGESMASLKKRMAAGGVSAQEVAEAFKIATSEGGMFFNGMDRASKTFSGQFSTLMDEVAELGRSFGEILLPAIKDIVTAATKWVQQFAALDDAQKKTIVVIAALAASIGPLLLGIGQAVRAISVLQVALAAASGPAGWITLFVAALALIGVTIYKNIKAQKDYDAALSGTSKLAAEEQIKILTAKLAEAEEQYGQIMSGWAEYSDKYKAAMKDQKESLEADIKQHKDRIAALKESMKPQEDLTGSISDSIPPLEELSEAEKAYAAAMAMARSEIDKSIPELEKLYAQFDILQNLKTTSSEDEEARLKALSIIRAQAFEIEMEQMRKMGKATEELATATEALDVQLEESAAGMKAQAGAIFDWQEAYSETSSFLSVSLVPNIDKVAGAISRLTGVLGEQDSELVKSIGIWKDWIGGFARIVSGDWIGGIIQMIDGLTTAIKGNIEAIEKSKEKSSKDIFDFTKLAGKSVRELYDALITVQTMAINMPPVIVTMLSAIADGIKEEIKKSLATSITDALNEALIAGSYADFSQAIGKLVYSIAAQFVMAQVGIMPMIEGLSAMIVSALEDGAIDASEMSGIEAEAARIYSAASAALAPLQSIINSTFGTSIGVQAPASSGGGGGSSADVMSTSSFASGVRSFSGGIARVGEQGPEYVRLPAGASVYSRGETAPRSTVFNFNSPRELSPMETRRRYQVMSRQLAWEGNLA